MQNAIPELWESPFLHCPLRPGEKLEHSAHNWNSKLQSPPTNHKQVLVCRRLSKAGTVGIWALLPTRSYTRCGWIHDRSRRPRGNADVKCSPRARWLQSVVCQRCPERTQRNAECKPAVPGSEAVLGAGSDPAGSPADSEIPKLPVLPQPSAREGTASRAPPLGTCPGALLLAASGVVQGPRQTHPKLQHGRREIKI